jgi:iron complex transport system substrate-binding protein
MILLSPPASRRTPIKEWFMSRSSKTFSALALSLALLLPATVHAESSFVDHRGKTITFAKPPERVVTIVRSAPIVYRAIDAKADNIAGMNKDSLVRYFTKGIYAEMLPEMAKINASAAQDGFVPNVEAILAQKPDAVIQWTHDEKIIEPLERVGLTVIGWQCCTEQDRLDYLTLTGYMTGRNDRAQAILKAQADTLKTLDGKVAKLDAAALPTVLHIDKVADQIQVIANGSQNLALSGVSNPAADNTGEWWRTIDFEQLLVWNPRHHHHPRLCRRPQPEGFLRQSGSGEPQGGQGEAGLQTAGLRPHAGCAGNLPDLGMACRNRAWCRLRAGFQEADRRHL